MNNMKVLNEILEHLESISTLEEFKQQTLILFESYFQLPHSIFWLCKSDYSVFEPTSNNIDSSILTSYLNHFSHLDILLPKNIFSHHKKVRVLTILDVIPKTTYEKSNYFNDFMRTNHFIDEMGLYLFNNHTPIGGISFAIDGYRFSENKHILRLFEALTHFLSMKLDKLLIPTNQLIASKSEKVVFDRLLKGETDEEIAERLHLSIHTVKKHLRSMYKKNGVQNRTSLIAKVYKNKN